MQHNRLMHRCALASAANGFSTDATRQTVASRGCSRADA
ncbi:hypothetical protein RISK_005989 [Rhodopirellula islandica]|uniref:Uncharacterized protein n=1 Tax=Rhodopirellula islandica TaxID=595434 RepID=A0A0J1B4M7_RHOIS|nr:hypothetical protein RISK_005989 [Rhodopirellula islandica]